MQVLFLTTIIPTRQRIGSEVASQCFIDGLRQSGHQVSVVGYMRENDTFEPELQDLVVGKRYIETQEAGMFRAIAWFCLSLLLNLPYSAAKYYSRAYYKAVKALLKAHQYDVILIDHPQLGWLKPLIRTKARLVIVTHNIEHEIYSNNTKTSQNWLERWIYARESRLIKSLEDKLATTAREVWTLTVHDSNYFRSLSGIKRVRAFTLPPGLATPTEHPVQKEFDIGLIGSWTWKANQEGLQWFLQQVYPRLSKPVSIRVAGRGADWLVDHYPGIDYCGFVPDAQEFMAKARIVAIPTLRGSGIQIKTLDAIASGSVIVATPIALRGISDLPITVQIAEQADEFAAQLSSKINSLHLSSCQASSYSLNWYCDRQKQFLQELVNAMNALQI